MPSSGVQTCALDRKSTRLNSSHTLISYAVFCFKKKKKTNSLNAMTQTIRAHINNNAQTHTAPASLFSTFELSCVSLLFFVVLFFFFFFNDTATTEIYTLSLHDALPISRVGKRPMMVLMVVVFPIPLRPRSEEHTSELQSHSHLVCRLLLEKKKKTI